MSSRNLLWSTNPQIEQIFRDSGTVSHSDRQRLWSECRVVCESVREEQNRKRQSRVNKSHVKKEVIESDIREAASWVKGSKSVGDSAEAQSQAVRLIGRFRNWNTLYPLLNTSVSNRHFSLP